ncbi:hypothetical protein FN846DRAFT_908801 [Sphaerosporella brunnea]|uniref:Uncharacterized protein n=1 Tax=Sphaerosporella brunnea TaxID=1250544 RepID=A0A5J5ESP2_9PEZI|nr:hypothetical protein FN846DRAFT_908801 [Sphaerosporella brunnea]
MTAPAAPPQSTPAKGRAKLTPATPSTRAPAKERGKSAPAAPPALAPAKERAKLTHAAALAPAKGRAKSKQLGGWKKGKSSSSPAASTDPESTRDIRSPHPRTIINNENDRPQALNRFNQFLRPVAASLAIPFPAETFHQFFSLTNKQRASLRSCPHWKLLDVTSNFPRNSGSEAAEAFFQNVLSEEKIEEMSRLQRFDAWANEVAKDMPVLMRAATWEAAMMLNVATLSAPAGPARAAGSGPLLEAAMVRWFERALGATVEDMWRLRPHLLRQKLRLQQPHQKQPWSAYKPTQEADPKLFNLNFPSASGVVKFYPSLPGVVQEFFDDPIMLEYVERSYDAVVVAQTELRANYTPQVKALFELDWCGIGETHRMAIVAKALSNLFFMDDPVQLAGLAGAEGWLPEDPLHPKFSKFPHSPRPHPSPPLAWRMGSRIHPETLSSAPTALFSLLGWLLGT